VLSNCDKILHPIVIARVGTSDNPNLVLAVTYGYTLSPPKNSNGMYEQKYTIPPAAAPALAVSTQIDHCTTYRKAKRNLGVHAFA